MLIKARLILNKFFSPTEAGVLYRFAFQALSVRLIGLLTGFLFTWMVAKYCGAGVLGIITICTATLNIAGTLCKWGIDIAASRIIAECDAKQQHNLINSFYKSAYFRVFIQGLLGTIVLILARNYIQAYLIKQSISEYILMINYICLIPISFILFNAESLRGLRRVSYYTFFATASISTLSTIMLSVALLLQLPAMVAIYIQFGSILISFILSQYCWHRFKPSISSQEKFSMAAIWKVAHPMQGTALLQLIMAWMAVLMLSYFFNENISGIFNTLIRIAALVNFGLFAIIAYAMPRITAAFVSSDMIALTQITKISARLNVMFASVVTGFLLLFNEFILSIFGNYFLQYRHSFIILIIGQFVITCTGIPAQVLNATDRQPELRNVSAIAASVFLLVCMATIPLHGIIGAAYATLSCQLTNQIIAMFYVKKYFNINTFIH